MDEEFCAYMQDLIDTIRDVQKSLDKRNELEEARLQFQIKIAKELERANGIQIENRYR